MPGQREVVFGGAVKFQLLHEAFPNAPRDFNVLYLGSSSMPLEAGSLVRLARRRGASFVWNQNGVAYPGWYGGGWELVNEARARLLLLLQARRQQAGQDQGHRILDDAAEDHWRGQGVEQASQYAADRHP